MVVQKEKEVRFAFADPVFHKLQNRLQWICKYHRSLFKFHSNPCPHSATCISLFSLRCIVFHFTCCCIPFRTILTFFVIARDGIVKPKSPFSVFPTFCSIYFCRQISLSQSSLLKIINLSFSILFVQVFISKRDFPLALRRTIVAPRRTVLVTWAGITA